MPPRPSATPKHEPASGTKTTATKAAATKAAAQKGAAPHKVAPAPVKAPAKATAAKATTPPAPSGKPAPRKSAAPKATTAAPANGSHPTPKRAPAEATKGSPVSQAAKSTAAKSANVKSSAPAAKSAAAKPAAAKAPAPAKPATKAPAKKAAAAPRARVLSDYMSDLKFIERQKSALLAERATYLEQANSLKAEAEALVLEMEPGDIQFDDESGEGGTATVDRERDLALSAQALAAVEDIDDALTKITRGTYGICEGNGELIAKARLEALPYAKLCIACKSGGLSRR
jgi:RNA polymerase-binding transcription factor DksA